jgi:hypothetical protein
VILAQDLSAAINLARAFISLPLHRCAVPVASMHFSQKFTAERGLMKGTLANGDAAFVRPFAVELSARREGKGQ